MLKSAPEPGIKAHHMHHPALQCSKDEFASLSDVGFSLNKNMHVEYVDAIVKYVDAINLS